MTEDRPIYPQPLRIRNQPNRSALALLAVLAFLAGWVAHAFVHPQPTAAIATVKKDQRIIVEALNALSRRVHAIDQRTRPFDRFTSPARRVK